MPRSSSEPDRFLNTIVNATIAKAFVTSPDLRLSCDLSEEENNFLDRRRVRVKEALETYLGGEPAPRHVDEAEVPRVAVLGSGGGFRAMVAFSSVLKTLHETGVFPCVTYLASLSGSSW
uniref:PLA2c domain-containing protein n=1 Tax=Timema tahoe TaxID=61484 RepID=A0A7R9FF44_9NEOP|nr:unnamed protein product [Timema tahoe]